MGTWWRVACGLLLSMTWRGNVESAPTNFAPKTPLLAARFVILSSGASLNEDEEMQEWLWPCLVEVSEWRHWHACGRRALDEVGREKPAEDEQRARAMRMMQTALRLNSVAQRVHHDIAVLYAQEGSSKAGYAVYHSSKVLAL